MIRYQITSANPVTHYFDVSIQISRPDPQGQKLRLPNWIPGSYMIRDFARNLLDLKVTNEHGELSVEQLDKSNWMVEATTHPIDVSYRVYAKDLSVRSAHLDASHGYFNGTSVFLEVLGLSELPCEVLIERPPVELARTWQLATSLARKEADAYDFGLYQAENYDDLIDHPVEMGNFERVSFEACGVPHDVILTGRFVCDLDRLAADLKTICEFHIRFFGEPAPMDYYQFQVLVVGDGYGGLEHRASTSLVCSRDSLPKPGQQKITDDYRDFLGLCSHEYFHTWNVKRIKPKVYQPYDLQQEVYTPLLWAFEGITSYYDDLALVRCGLIDQSAYLELLSQTITRVARGKGRTRQSAGESSFNTWTKFYKQDENAANAIVSYYAKGCLIAACIDLRMRSASDGESNLDDVMRALWQQYQATAPGVGEDDIQQLICLLSGADLSSELQEWIYGTAELPLEELLGQHGVELLWRASQNQSDKGGKEIDGELPRVDFGAFLKMSPNGLEIQRVSEQGAAQLAGLAAGDVIVAVNGLKTDQAKLEKQLALAVPDDVWQLHAFRRDELFETDVTLQAAAETTAVLKAAEQNSEQRNLWLQSES